MPPRRKVVLPVPPAPVVEAATVAEPEPVAEPVAEAVVIAEPEPVLAVKEVKEVKKKRVKKQIQVVAIVTPDGIEGNFQSNEPRRSLVAHLQVRSNEVQFFDQPLQYNPNPPNQPEPYDETIDNLFSGNNCFGLGTRKILPNISINQYANISITRLKQIASTSASYADFVNAIALL